MPFCQQFRLYKVFEAYFDANFPMYEATAPANPNINAPVLSQLYPLLHKFYIFNCIVGRAGCCLVI